MFLFTILTLSLFLLLCFFLFSFLWWLSAQPKAGKLGSGWTGIGSMASKARKGNRERGRGWRQIEAVRVGVGKRVAHKRNVVAKCGARDNNKKLAR